MVFDVSLLRARDFDDGGPVEFFHKPQQKYRSFIVVHFVDGLPYSSDLFPNKGQHFRTTAVEGDPVFQIRSIGRVAAVGSPENDALLAPMMFLSSVCYSEQPVRRTLVSSKGVPIAIRDGKAHTSQPCGDFRVSDRKQQETKNLRSTAFYRMRQGGRDNFVVIVCILSTLQMFALFHVPVSSGSLDGLRHLLLEGETLPSEKRSAVCDCFAGKPRPDKTRQNSCSIVVP